MPSQAESSTPTRPHSASVGISGAAARRFGEALPRALSFTSRGETVEEACMVHGVDADAFLAQVNRFIEANEEAEKAK